MDGDTPEKQFCDLCQLYFPSSIRFERHLVCKHHKENAERVQNLEELKKKSVMLRGFWRYIDDVLFKSILSEYGSITNLIVKPDKKYCFVEFLEEESVRNLVKKKEISIGRDHRIKVCLRETANEKPQIDIGSIEIEEVLEMLENTSQIEDQVEILMKNFAVDAKIRLHREKILFNLESYIQKYFLDPIRLILHGSTVSGFGNKYCDADVSFLFVSEIQKSDRVLLKGSLLIDALTDDVLSSRDVEDRNIRLPYVFTKEENIEKFKEQPIKRAELERLFTADQCKLLEKIFYAYAIDHGKISDICEVWYTKKPLVQLIYDKEFAIQVCAGDQLGRVKANFVAEVAKKDKSGLMKNFVFTLRLWAMLNGIFDEDGHPRGQFKSYPFSLFIVAYLQQLGIIRPMKFREPKLVQGCNVAYDFDEFDLSSVDMKKLFMDFFNFMITTIHENTVHCLRNGKIFSADEFYNLYCAPDEKVKEGFKFNRVNIQDPIEQSHNVGGNVNRHYFMTIKKKSLQALEKLHKDGNIRDLFLLDDPGSSSLNATQSHGFTLILPIPSTREKVICYVNCLMEELLLFTPISSKIDSSLENSATLSYMISIPIWKARENLVREFSEAYTRKKEVNIEKMVSEEIRRITSFVFEHLFKCRLALKLSENELKVDLDFEGGSQEDRENFYKFLETFMEKYVHLIKSQWIWNYNVLL